LFVSPMQCISHLLVHMFRAKSHRHQVPVSPAAIAVDDQFAGSLYQGYPEKASRIGPTRDLAVAQTASRTALAGVDGVCVAHRGTAARVTCLRLCVLYRRASRQQLGNQGAA